MNSEYREDYVSGKRKYTGNIIGVDLVTVTLPNGKNATRDVVVHPGASVVVPVNENGDVYLVRQFRTPIGKSTLELPAGKLDAGEEPRVCAERELFEETGLTASNVKHLFSIHSTPGFCNEVLHMYLATGLVKGMAQTDDDEFLTVEKFNIKDLPKMIYNGEITDAKTIIGIFAARDYVEGIL